MMSILKSCFKSVNKTKLESLAQDINHVAIGSRISHLIDVCSVNMDQAKILLGIRKDLPSLVLLQFKDRFTFVCHKKRLREYIESTLNNNVQLTFVDVQDKEPIKTNSIPSQLVYWLENQLLPFLSNQDTLYYSPIIPTCMVAVTGYVLEYPVVYTTHLVTDDPRAELDEWEVRTNCLGNRTLQVFQVWVSNHLLMSFSVPQGLDIDNKEIEHGLQTKYPTCQIRSHTVKMDRFAL
ncbi:unnamed protein product [Rhizopus microsporus]|uniref:Uncharacterized protein n=2 Tax=Rhizopus TaxID=4842 RepID=A0A1X0SFV7_RHIZD|nr:hypothetical protein BCV71DRAFT_224130 [Rhizopus microsporus]